MDILRPIEKKIVLLDDNFVIRNVIKTFLGKLEQQLDIDFKIFSSDNGVQGIGYVFITNPDIVIVDSTLPKYSGREIVEYLTSNPKFTSGESKVIVVYEGVAPEKLPKSFSTLNKKDKNFLKALIHEISMACKDKKKLELPKPLNTKLLTVGAQTILWANRSDIVIDKIRTSSIFIKHFYLIIWIIYQIIESFFLTILKVTTRNIDDDNIEQVNKDEQRYRIRYYPAMAALITFAVIIIMQICAFVSGGTIIFQTANRIEETRAAVGDDFKIQRGTTTIAAGSFTATLTAGVDYTAPSANSKAFVRITNTGYTGAGHNSGGGSQNANQTTVTLDGGGTNLVSSFQFIRGTNTNTTRVSWEIVEYIGAASGVNEFVVRNVGELGIAGGASQVSSAAISGVVDATDVVVFITGQRNVQSNLTTFNEILFTSEYVSGTNTARLTRGDTTNLAAVSYAVVEFTGSNWKIQRTEHTYTAAGSTETNTITAVNNLSRAFIHAQKRSGVNLAGLDEFGHEVWLSSTTQVSFLLQSGATTPSGQVSVAWVIENTQTVGGVMNVIRGNTTKAASGSEPGTVNVSYGPITDLTKASIFANNRSAGTGTTYPNGIFAVTLTSTSNIEFWFSDNANTQAMRYEVVEWPTAPKSIMASTSGSQNTSVFYPVTNYHIGGMFVLTNTTGSRNITGITIREQGTIDAQNHIDNIKLYYDSDTSAPYDCASESYAGSETQFGSTDTDGFNGANGTSTFTGSVGVTTTSTMCVYVVLDVISGDLIDQTIEIDINAPDSDITVSAGDVGPSTTVAISGISTITASANITAIGTQSSILSIGTTNNYIGGSFSIVSANGSLNVTSITIAEQGTVDGSTNIANVKLLYDSDTSAPYDCSSESYAGSESQFGSTDTNGFSSANGNSTFSGSVEISATSTMCIYPVMDITSGAALNETIEIQVSNPMNNIILSAGTTGPSSVITINGTTTLKTETEVSIIGDQVEGLSRVTVDQYVGGLIRIASNSGSKSVTGITIREQGTIDAQNHIDNIKLVYDSDTSSPYDCIGESYDKTESQFGSTDTDGFNGSNGSASFTGSVGISTTSTMCVYVILDITSGASAGQSLEIDIANPSTDITVSIGSIGPSVDVGSNSTSTITNAGAFSAGMLVYDDNQTDTPKYKTMSTSGTWSSQQSALDVDPSGVNVQDTKGVRLYSSESKDEYVMVSTHGNGSTQWLYAQVYNGGTASWGNLQQLTTFSAGTLGSSEYRFYFDGTYLDNGDFMVVYSDLTNTPKFSIWNGSNWSTVSGSTQSLGTGALTSNVIAKARPGTNEVMVIVQEVNSSDETTSLYYDGSGTSSSDWTILSVNGSSLDSGNNTHTDFTWSTNNPTRGLLTYANDASTTRPYVNIFTADGSGGGNWGTANSVIDIGDEPGQISLADRPGYDSFLFCVRHANLNPFELNCLFEGDNDTTPTIQTTSNGEVSVSIDTTGGPHKPMGVEFEQVSANKAIVVYSETSVFTPKLKTYDPSNGTTGTWDTTAFNLSNVTEQPRAINLYADPNTDNIAILVRTTGSDIHTIFWDGTNNTVYSSGDRSMIEHATNSALNSPSQSHAFAWKLYAPNLAPSVTSVSVNSGSDINLTENTTTTVSWLANVTDTNGYTDITNVTGKLYRSGVASAQNCTPNNNNCYSDASCTLFGCSGNSCVAQCDATVQFHADPTDSGIYNAEYWLGWVQATDTAAQTGEAFSPNNITDINSLVALDIASTIGYGTILPGNDTGNSNQVITVINTGNVIIDGEISGTNLCSDFPTCSGSAISVGTQKYALNTFSYNSGTALTTSPVAAQLNATKPTTAPSNGSKTVYWGIGLPSIAATGAHSGTVTITATTDQ